MIIHVPDIPSDGLVVDAVVPSPYADPAWRLDGVALRLTPDGRDVFVSGAIDASVPQVCGRCAEPFPARIHADVAVRVAPRPAAPADTELGADDLDVVFYTNDELNLATLIETETTLALPMKPLCRPDCRGLCPVCGVNRNVTPCACGERPPDPRLAGLQKLADRLSR